MNKHVIRRIASIILVIAVALLASGCRPLVEEADRISVYATFYPIYALADAVMREVPDAELHCLVQPQDGCLRNYALSDWDIALLNAGADAVLMGGRGLEGFESTLFGWGEDGPAMSALLYNLELYNQGQVHADPEAESHLKGANPHLYMSIDGAKQIVESASASMVSLDPQYSKLYAANTEAALARLDALLEENRALLTDCAGARVALLNETLIYVVQDYGLEVAAWIDRESGAVPGDNELAAWLEQLSGAEIGVVLIERQAPQALIEALEAAGYAVARLDVMSTHREGEGFDQYIEIQRGNAQALRDAFDRAQAMEEAD